MTLQFRVTRILILVSLAACSTLDIHTDHDPAADFSRYKTYSWAPPASGQQAPDSSGVPSELVEQRIHAAVDSRLPLRGLSIAPMGQEADLLVYDRVAQKEKIQSSQVGLGLGLGFGYDFWSGFGAVPGSETHQYTQGTLVIDLVDAKSRNLIWRGTATDATSPSEENQDKINEAVSKILEKFPPGLKKK